MKITMRKAVALFAALLLVQFAILGLTETAYATSQRTPRPAKTSTSTRTPKPTATPAPDGWFDHTQFENKPGYKYQKITKEYRFEADTDETYSDAYFAWGLVAEGKKNEAGSL
ncbi:MAG: hypothetical protein IKP40_09190 [Clostridia bacterium]|nr:hypothetical protein [Clostridia bacterium]